MEACLPNNIDKLKELTDKLPLMQHIERRESGLVEYELEKGTCIGINLYKVKDIAVQRAFLSQGSVFDKHTHEEVEHIIPRSEADRILQFHRLVLLMNVDKKQDLIEINKIHNIGLGMGLPPSAIEQVLSIMHKYPNKIVPPKVLINIFKAHYN